MQQFINQYSFIFVGFLLVVLITLVLSRFTTNRLTFIAFLVAVVILVGIQSQMRSTIDQYDSTEDFDKAMASGSPVFLFLYSDY